MPLRILPGQLATEENLQKSITRKTERARSLNTRLLVYQGKALDYYDLILKPI